MKIFDLDRMIKELDDGLDYDGDILNGELVNTKKDHEDNSPFGYKYAKIWDTIIDDHAAVGDIGFFQALAAVFVGKEDKP